MKIKRFAYRIDVRPEAGGFRVAVQFDRAIPDALAGKAGFNLEFLPGGIIPGVVNIQPEFPELKEGWPFLWYVIDTVTSYILAANAANAETQSTK